MITVDRAELAATLTRAAAVAGKTMEVLAHIRLEQTDGLLSVSATDLDIGVQLTIPAKGTLNPVLAPASIARQVSALPAETVTLKVDKDRLVVTGGATFRLPTYKIDDWPSVELPTTNQWSPPEGFADTFTAMATHAAQKARPILEVVHLGTQMLATDSYRLAMVDTPDGPADPILVPFRVSLKGHVDQVTWDNRHVVFHTPDGKQWARLVEGSYPKVATIVNQLKDPLATVTVNAVGLSEAFERASLVADEAKGVALSVDTESVTVSVEGTRGDYTEQVDAKVEGEHPESPSLRAQFVRQALAPVDGDVTIELHGGNRPALFTAGEWRVVINPIVGRPT